MKRTYGNFCIKNFTTSGVRGIFQNGVQICWMGGGGHTPLFPTPVLLLKELSPRWMDLKGQNWIHAVHSGRWTVLYICNEFFSIPFVNCNREVERRICTIPRIVGCTQTHLHLVRPWTPLLQSWNNKNPSWGYSTSQNQTVATVQSRGDAKPSGVAWPTAVAPVPAVAAAADVVASTDTALPSRSAVGRLPPTDTPPPPPPPITTKGWSTSRLLFRISLRSRMSGVRVWW